MPRPKKPLEQRGEPGRKRCPACTNLAPTASRNCPECGHLFPRKQPISPMEMLDLMSAHWRYVESAGGCEKALDLAGQLKWLHERMGGWDQVLQMLTPTCRIVDGIAGREAAG